MYKFTYGHFKAYSNRVNAEAKAKMFVVSYPECDDRLLWFIPYSQCADQGCSVNGEVYV